ncbi:GNAT family N-acetyltransferase [Pseudokineococcus lusitanus]|jgi:predicted GNAT family acetyltransferase|uniref:N-acetyltransferase domain-containing protein n=1 Tax=Pseudokineococcus lusitanus TaxID=763993 RepID=A0A3N1G946_9ACTN|nr:GNAT family N-acetyltransferase [Pseudokineococcus lusitanus]ROP26765.1 hypothetical protein EDC03_3235 [Pseudokineococcus lusitanus]
MTSDIASSGGADEGTGVRRREDGWVLLDDGAEVASVVAEPAGVDVLALTHTVTDPARRGEGLAGRLVEAVLADVRREGLTVRPECSYVAAWFARHPDQRDLLAT